MFGLAVVSNSFRPGWYAIQPSVRAHVAHTDRRAHYRLVYKGGKQRGINSSDIERGQLKLVLGRQPLSCVVQLHFPFLTIGHRIAYVS